MKDELDDNGSARYQDLKEKVGIDEIYEMVTEEPCHYFSSRSAEPYDGVCPFCDHNDCLRFQLDDDYFNCFSCEVGGDGIAFAARYWDVRPGEALYRLEKLVKEYEATGVKDTPLKRKGSDRLRKSVMENTTRQAATEREFQILEAIAQHAVACLNATPKALEYQLHVRKHAPETLDRMRVGFLADDLWGILKNDPLKISLDELKALGLATAYGWSLLRPGCYVYPHVNPQGRVCRFTQKDPSGRVKVQQYREGYLDDIKFYGENTLVALKQGDRIALVEGENDLLSVLEAGWDGPVLATNGGPSQEQFNWINEHAADCTIITFFDADDAGNGFREKTASSLKVASLEQYKVPSRKDVDEYLKEGSTLATLLQPENLWQAPAHQGNEQTSILRQLLRAAGRDSVHDISDMDLANLALSAQKCPIKFIPEDGKWARCSDLGIWSYEQDHNIVRGFALAGEDWRRAANEIGVDPKDLDDSQRAERKKCMDFAFQLQRRRSLDDLITLASTKEEVRVRKAAFDPHLSIIGVKNGAFDLREGRFFVPNPSLLISKSCGTPYVEDATCPQWLLYLDRVTGHLEAVEKLKMLKYLQRIAGESLFFKSGRRRFFFLGGPPGSGKSVFVSTLLGVCGSYAVAMPTESMMATKSINHGPRPDLLKMIGARLITASEAGDQYSFDDEQLKRITGGDTVSARGLFKDVVEFPVGGNIIITGNSFPRSQTGGAAFMQRIKVVMFPNALPEAQQDHQLVDKLHAEWPGILKWAIEGATDALNGVPLDTPECVLKDTAAYQDLSNPVKAFIEESCVKSTNMKVSKQELIGAYRAWADENGCPRFSNISFSRRMKELGYIEIRDGNTRCWAGLDWMGVVAPVVQYDDGPEYKI